MYATTKQVIADSINAQDIGADWRYVVPSTIPLGSDQIAVGIIYDAKTLSPKVRYLLPGKTDT